MELAVGGRGRSVVLRFSLAALVMLLPSAAESAEYSLELLWSEPLFESQPLIGSPADLDITLSGEILVLDEQLHVVHRWGVDGRRREGRGRRGQGPGEFDWPKIVTAMPDGGLVCFEHFSHEPACIDAFGEPCDIPSLRPLVKDRGFLSVVDGHPDGKGGLVIGAMTAIGGTDGRTPRGHDQLYHLDDLDADWVPLHEELIRGTIQRGWDVSSTGTLAVLIRRAEPRVRLDALDGNPVREIVLEGVTHGNSLSRAFAAQNGLNHDEFPSLTDIGWVDHQTLWARSIQQIDWVSGLETFSSLRLFDGREPLWASFPWKST